jgi:hypothetical protein
VLILRLLVVGRGLLEACTGLCDRTGPADGNGSSSGDERLGISISR